ncbi:hypothetical protein E2P81_ATG03810 [Venturia nashicola]|uniref:Uncharacterized protein n=1 Tax=Venturia nashicola TaxID=86259 RepID=A0A4Z1PBP6_9PEZI|nr:hypothetical protein E6O75_ATG03898 [Venturia nashicola]TLD38135.1 hypothetical protein E2P81_ATG03810 [Venturia nashicola]
MPSRFDELFLEPFLPAPVMKRAPRLFEVFRDPEDPALHPDAPRTPVRAASATPPSTPFVKRKKPRVPRAPMKPRRSSRQVQDSSSSPCAHR